jgi:hypothetical protein
MHRQLSGVALKDESDVQEVIDHSNEELPNV